MGSWISRSLRGHGDVICWSLWGHCGVMLMSPGHEESLTETTLSAHLFWNDVMLFTDYLFMSLLLPHCAFISEFHPKNCLILSVFSPSSIAFSLHFSVSFPSFVMRLQCALHCWTLYAIFCIASSGCFALHVPGHLVGLF